jgi:uncharacterized membrane protein
MHARNSFGVGFMRGLNSVAEVFAPYPGVYEDPPIGQARSGWTGLRENMKDALGVAFAKISPGVSEQQLPESRRSSRPITRFVSARWRGPLPPPTELEKIDQIIPGGADRLLRMAEQDLERNLQIAEKEQACRIQTAEKEQEYRIEDSRRGYEDSRRGQWLGWFLAVGALIAAAVASLFHAPWQASVALVGIPVLGAVQALIQGRKREGQGGPPAGSERLKS